jgi:tetraacyldisaccharide 4'-kinase
LSLAERLVGAVASRRLARPLHLPSAPVIGIGGAVLGGAGKTPVCCAWASALALQGKRVAVVAHGYRATAREPQLVRADSPVWLVGDDALVLARALGPLRVPVWVARSRAHAIARAAADAEVVVVDGLLQARPERLSHSVLVLDAARPWGGGWCVPRGDLRAQPRALLAACDEVVLVTDPVRDGALAPGQFGPARLATLQILGFSEDSGAMVPLAGTAGLRLGLLLLVARPGRIRASLLARGLHLACEWLGSDHRAPNARELRELERLARRHRLDAWVVTPKCRTHLSQGPAAPLWSIQSRVRLDPDP